MHWKHIWFFMNIGVSSLLNFDKTVKTLEKNHSTISTFYCQINLNEMISAKASNMDLAVGAQ